MSRSPFETFPHIETDRLVLRRLTGGDVDALFEIFGDESLFAYISAGMLAKDPGAIPPMLERLEVHFGEGRMVMLGIERRDTPGVVGIVNLFGYDAQIGKVTLGYLIGRRHGGQGIATEAVAGMVRYLFETLDMARVEATVVPGNDASLRVLAKNGFVEEGILRQGGWQEGHGVVDLTLLALLKTEYKG